MLNYLLLFGISMLPVIELRGAIPIGCGLGVPWWSNLLCCVIGNLLPVPFLLLFVEKILLWMKEKRIFPRFVDWLEQKAGKGAAKVEKYALLGLFLFVAIPLPGTGAWTGSLVASLFHMDRRHTFLSIVGGVITAGVIMTLASYGVVSWLSFLMDR